ncbi:diguanylate cyclase [Sulfurimonas sp. HSL-1716]|uniref:GGDEF domain-containing protein n=1 Tax=Hydrocurvibacter sulfurireducens TaxID=3131937 RepID=UPI0031F83340
MKKQNSFAQEKSFERFSAYINSSSFIFLSWELDTQWNVNYISQSISQFGYTQEEFLNKEKRYEQIIYHEDVDRVVMELETHKSSDVDCFNQIYRIVTAEGDIKWVDVHTVVERNSAGEVANFLGIVKDITKEKFQSLINDTSNYSLKELYSMNILAQAVKQTDDMVLITNHEGVIIFVNDALLKHSGYTLEETIDQTPRIFKSEEHSKSFYKNFWDTILQGKTYHGVFKNRKKNGTIYHEAETVTPITDEKSNIKYFVATGKDISDRIALENELHRQATIDLLTGVYNRQKFVKEIENELDRLKRYNNKFALIMIDIDHFKDINDTYGHDAGDKILKEICDVIGIKIRKSDTFARWGGEEFMLITPGLSEQEVFTFAERIRLSVASSVFDGIDHITISLGITLPKEEDTLKDIFKRVDEALYHAKHNGRNQVHFI